MNARRTTTALLAAAALTLLAGCDRDGDGIDDETGRPVPAISSHKDADPGTGQSGCDPAGWGPLSGCDRGDDSEDGSPFGGLFADTPASCPDLNSRTITYDPDSGDAVDVEGPPVPAQCIADLSAQNREFNERFGDEVNKRLGDQ